MAERLLEKAGSGDKKKRNKSKKSPATDGPQEGAFLLRRRHVEQLSLACFVRSAFYYRIYRTCFASFNNEGLYWSLCYLLQAEYY